MPPATLLASRRRQLETLLEADSAYDPLREILADLGYLDDVDRDEEDRLDFRTGPADRLDGLCRERYLAVGGLYDGSSGDYEIGTGQTHCAPTLVRMRAWLDRKLGERSEFNAWVYDLHAGREVAFTIRRSVEWVRPTARRR